MKQLLKIITLLIVPSIAFALMNFKRDSPLNQQERKLVGKWKHDYQYENQTALKGISIYSGDRTWKSRSDFLRKNERIEVMELSGTWKITGDQLIMECIYQEQGLKLKSKIVEITDNTYTYIAIDGTEKSETRVRDEN